MDRDETYAILSVQADGIEHLLGFHPLSPPSLAHRFHNGLVDGDRSNRDGRLVDDFLAHGPQVSPGGEVHDGICSCFYRSFQLTQLEILIMYVT